MRETNNSRGIAIEEANPVSEARKNAEVASDWEYREQADCLYKRAGILRRELVDPVAFINRDQMPDPVIAFEGYCAYS